GEGVGVVNVSSKSTGQPFDPDDLSLLVAISKRVGTALERVRTAGASGDVYTTLNTIRTVIRAKRKHALWSSRRAFKLATRLGRPRLSARALRRRHPARGADPRPGGRVRGHDAGTSVPRLHVGSGSSRRDPPLLRNPVRSQGRRGARGDPRQARHRSPCLHGARHGSEAMIPSIELLWALAASVL